MSLSKLSKTSLINPTSTVTVLIKWQESLLVVMLRIEIKATPSEFQRRLNWRLGFLQIYYQDLFLINAFCKHSDTGLEIGTAEMTTIRTKKMIDIGYCVIYTSTQFFFFMCWIKGDAKSPSSALLPWKLFVPWL